MNYIHSIFLGEELLITAKPTLRCIAVKDRCLHKVRRSKSDHTTIAQTLACVFLQFSDCGWVHDFTSFLHKTFVSHSSEITTEWAPVRKPSAWRRQSLQQASLGWAVQSCVVNCPTPLHIGKISCTDNQQLTSLFIRVLADRQTV